MTDAAITIEPNAADVASVQRTFSRLTIMLGKDAREAVRWTAWYVARSMGASTRVAPARRKLLRTEEGTPGLEHLAGKAKISTRQAAGWWHRHVERYTRDGKMYNKFIARNEDHDAARRIRNKGLAKKAWVWMVGKQQSTEDRYSAIALGGTDRLPDALLHSKLRYASAALRPEAATAFERAERALTHYIERKALQTVRAAGGA